MINENLENLLAPLENESAVWHSRFLIFVNFLKKEPQSITQILHKVYELSPSQSGGMPSYWYEKSKKFKWEERAKKYIFECTKEQLKLEREIINAEKEKYISEIFELELIERAKRIKATIKMSDSFIVLSNVLEESANRYKEEWIEQLINVRDFTIVIKQMGDAIAKVADYQPKEFQAGKNMNIDTEVEFEVE